MIEVIRPGPLATCQDLGRPGLAHLGVPRSGAADAASLRLANRLVGNDEGAAAIELTLGQAVLAFDEAAWVAVTGAPTAVRVAAPPRGAETARRAGMNAPLHIPAGGRLEVGVPARGLRTYVAVRGGIAVPAVLGSRSTDTLSGLGPAPLTAGTRLPVGATKELAPIAVDEAPARTPPDVLRVISGPRAEWFSDAALATLGAATFTVSPKADRVGIRLDGPELGRRRSGELASEGMVTGAVQVPPDGRPIIFLADHPTTGGYPVIAVIVAADIPSSAQLRPGDTARFRMVNDV